MTPGGKFLAEREILQSELWETKPSWWFKVWFYIQANANFKDHNNKLKRGNLLTTYAEIYKDCHLAQEGVKQKAIDNLIRHLKSTKQITTRKTTRKFIITVCNYDQTQRFEAFTNDTDNYSRNDKKTTQERHDKETNVTNDTSKNYNYLKTSISTKGTTTGGETNLGTKPQPQSETPTDVIFVSLLKRLKPEIIGALNQIDTEEREISTNVEAAFKGIIYYIQKYGFVFQEKHPLYKKDQLRDCVFGFLFGIWEIEKKELPVDAAVIEVIERWFATTSLDRNKLRLSVFASQKSDVFFISLNGVLSSFDAIERIKNADS